MIPKWANKNLYNEAQLFLKDPFCICNARSFHAMQTWQYPRECSLGRFAGALKRKIMCINWEAIVLCFNVESKRKAFTK